MKPTTYLLIITLGAMVLDIVSGICKAVANNEMSSAKLREGAWHKMGFVGLIFLSYMLQIASIYANLGFEVPAIATVCIYIILTEAVSIFENLCRLNPAIAASPLGRVLDESRDHKE